MSRPELCVPDLGVLSVLPGGGLPHLLLPLHHLNPPRLCAHGVRGNRSEGSYVMCHKHLYYFCYFLPKIWIAVLAMLFVKLFGRLRWRCREQYFSSVTLPELPEYRRIGSARRHVSILFQNIRRKIGISLWLTMLLQPSVLCILLRQTVDCIE